MPFIDVDPSHPQFKSIQKVGATGMLRGTGIPYKWANQTWFYPDSTIYHLDFSAKFKAFHPNFSISDDSKEWLTIKDAHEFVNQLAKDSDFTSKRIPTLLELQTSWTKYGLENYDINRPIKRKELAVIMDKLANVFERPISMDGQWIGE